MRKSYNWCSMRDGIEYFFQLKERNRFSRASLEGCCSYECRCRVAEQVAPETRIRSTTGLVSKMRQSCWVERCDDDDDDVDVDDDDGKDDDGNVDDDDSDVDDDDVDDGDDDDDDDHDGADGVHDEAQDDCEPPIL